MHTTSFLSYSKHSSSSASSSSFFLSSRSLFFFSEMVISLVQTSSLTPISNKNPFHSSSSSSSSTPPKSLFLGNALNTLLFFAPHRLLLGLHDRPRNWRPATTRASLIDTPVLFWAGRMCIFYALLKSGLAGSHSNPIFSAVDSDGGGGDGVSGEAGGDMGFAKWMNSIKGKPVKEAADRRKLVSKWHPTTKGTLKRNYRVPSKSHGKRLLVAIAALLSEDDHFVDATSHKGCQIRRESAHGESVCCNNVRALFDELPTPHLIVEITPFPAGPLTENDYTKAEKLERVLRTGPSV